MSIHPRLVLIMATVLTFLSVNVGSGQAAFPQDPPDDPAYGAALFNTPELVPTEVEYYFYSFMPAGAPLARDPENAAGMSIDIAWKAFGAGREDVVIAYVEAGINWFDDSVIEIADKIYINRGELPAPRCEEGEGWPTCDNGDNWFNAPDFAQMGVQDQNGNGILDAEDLIVAFSNGEDDDGNGYVDDISGWDFYDDQNDPATYDGAYTHANHQMEQAAAITNNGFLGAGLCPRCMLLPVKAGAEALDRTDDLAQAWLFAADSGADVIVSTTADLGYSTFIREAIDSVADRGVVIVESSNDFNSTDHQGGMFHPRVLPGNGLVPDMKGIDGRLTTTYRARSCITSWGTQNMFSVPTRGGTTSESTPTVGGVIAMVRSGAEDAFEEGLVTAPLSGFELIQVLRETGSDIANPRLPWPGKPGWDLQYGYGRPNVYKAIAAIRQGEIPPVALIDSPRWFSLIDPTREATVQVEGRMAALRALGYSWKVEVGPGPEPKEEEFLVVRSGSGQDAFEGVLALVDLETLDVVSPSFYARSFSISDTKALETTEQYTVTLRLRVTDDQGRTGEDRRSVFVHHDPTWHAPFPRFMGPGGEGQACLADLQSQGRLAIVFGDTDGFVHALDSLTGEELDGWPAHTLPTAVTRHHEGVDPRYEPLLAPLSVGDLDHDGDLWVVATSITGRTYVFDAYGSLREGWPRSLDAGVEEPALPRPSLPYTRLPTRGATAPPVLSDLDLDGALEIVQAAWDGHLYVFHADGTYLAGWPKKVELPRGELPEEGFIRINDQKLDSCPVIADLDGDGDREIVVKTQFSDTPGPDIQLITRIHVAAFHHDGSPVEGWPNALTSLATAYGTAQEFITEGSNSPVAADVDGDGVDEVVVSPFMSSPQLLAGNGSVQLQYMRNADRGLHRLGDAGAVLELLGKVANDEPVGFTTTGAFGMFDGRLTYAQAGSSIRGILLTQLTPGRGIWLKNFERVFDAVTGLPRAGFPVFLQGLNFLGAPLVVDVTGDGSAEIIDGGDSSALHAYTAGGGQAEGFPKFTTGWVLWSPTAGDLDADGDVELVALTREGYLMVWDTQGRAEANTEWWHYHHDEWNTGRYGTDTRPPGVIRQAALDRRGRKIRFTAPGDDWYAGTPAHYLYTYMPSGESGKVEASAGAGRKQSLAFPAGTTHATIQAVDDAGNLGRAVTLELAALPDEGKPRPPAAGDDDGGLCFIATASLGTERAGKLSVLTAFRDRVLLTNAPGRAFVDAYYEYSPPLASYIARREWLRALVRTLLLPVIGFASLFV